MGLRRMLTAARGEDVNLTESALTRLYSRLLHTEFYYASWHCAASRQVPGSIPDGVTWIFDWHNPSGPSIALVSTQPLTETSKQGKAVPI